MQNVISKENEKILKHLKTVAHAARSIAEHTQTLDPKTAYMFGMGHDVGKCKLAPSEYYQHPRVGFEMFSEVNPPLAAICISHPFLDFDDYDNILSYCKNDETEAKLVYDILKTTEMNDYIQLIQLCDKLSGIDKYVTIEDKLNWYHEKHNIPMAELDRVYREPLYRLKQKFDEMTNADVYEILGLK